jgi:putative DNA primase/helicase
MVAPTAVGSPALTFFTTVFGQKPDASHILIWTLPDKRSRWFQGIDAAARYAESLRQRDVYVGVCLSPQDFGPENRCSSENAAGVVALWADLDVRDQIHTKHNLPPTIDDALNLLPLPFTPSIVVHSGHGLHCWWLLKEPELFESDEHRGKVKAIVERWARLLKLNGAAHGWTVDSVFDLARVLRVPGTTNCKVAAAPKPITVVATSEKRYNLSDFAEYLDQAGVPDPAAEQRWQEKWKQQQQGAALSVRADASVPPGFIQRHCDAEERFRLTWHRQRNDLADQSQSSTTWPWPTMESGPGSPIR